VSAREKSSGMSPGVSCFGVEMPHAILTELPTRVRASIALELGLILELMGLGSSAARNVSAILKVGNAGASRPSWLGRCRAGRRVHRAVRRV
jgi:hypothetical protein